MRSSARIHLLPFEEEPGEEFLLALHTSIEAYQIAFFLNQHCQTQFKRIEDIILKNQAACFALFEWDNPLLDQKVSLFSNQYSADEVQTQENNTTLFDLPLRNQVSLFSEFKQVDFFIKSSRKELIQRLLKPLNSWNAVSMVYALSSSKMKNQLNLIFD
ncbi:MAG: IPExxxVDY family protein [Flavobacteriia bacterium]|jgi:hypothetical protein|nr:IPExxxVDY family protein [Flavobacteriia bacterium]